jgi:hypothetical protein
MSLLGWLGIGPTDDVDQHAPDLDCDCGSCAERWRVAVHEAGHVVAFDEAGEAWTVAEIMEDEDGESAGGRVEAARDSDDLIDPDDVYRYLVITEAGHAAELAVFGGYEPSREDTQMLSDLVARLLDYPGDPAADAGAEAEALIGASLPELEATAEELFTEGTIYP